MHEIYAELSVLQIPASQGHHATCYADDLEKTVKMVIMLKTKVIINPSNYSLVKP